MWRRKRRFVTRIDVAQTSLVERWHAEGILVYRNHRLLAATRSIGNTTSRPASARYDNGNVVGEPSDQDQRPLNGATGNPLPRFPKVMNDPTQRSRLVDSRNSTKTATKVICRKSRGSFPPTGQRTSAERHSHRHGVCDQPDHHVMKSSTWTKHGDFFVLDDWGVSTTTCRHPSLTSTDTDAGASLIISHTPARLHR